MGTSLSARVSAAIAAEYADTVDVGSVQHSVAYSPNRVFTDGTGANQAKKIFTDVRTLAASGTEDLDLAGGLTDAFGNAITFTKIKAIIVEAAAGNTNDVVVGGAASNAIASFFADATDKLLVKPGGFAMLVAPDANGYAVTASTGDLLKIANSAGSTSVSYTITIIGVV